MPLPAPKSSAVSLAGSIPDASSSARRRSQTTFGEVQFSFSS
jgi:hypothetical protein